VLRLIVAVGSFVADRAVERRLPAWAQRPKPKALPAWFWPLAILPSLFRKTSP
jgi:hypothetical protein